MRFNADRFAFGRHETFHLRFAWLSKGFAAFQVNSDLFEDLDSATVTLGVGKNMVQSIRVVKYLVEMKKQYLVTHPRTLSKKSLGVRSTLH